jgi:hypothetical protein
MSSEHEVQTAGVHPFDGAEIGIEIESEVGSLFVIPGKGGCHQGTDCFGFPTGADKELSGLPVGAPRSKSFGEPPRQVGEVGRINIGGGPGQGISCALSSEDPLFNGRVGKSQHFLWADPESFCCFFNAKRPVDQAG